jgi:hypothetical protein
MNISALVYSGMRIRNRDEMLCLTDMWRAAGGDDASKRPVDWLRSVEAQHFIEFLSENLNVEISHLLQIEQGRTGATWAHWQIGLAYAKYLSPEFHAWCNEVVRSHMELTHKGRDLPAIEVFGKLFDTKLDPIHKKLDRTHAAVEGTGGKVVQLIDSSSRLEKRMDDVIPRKDPSPQNQRIYLHTVAKRFDGYCPCGCRTKIVDDRSNPLLDERGKSLVEYDHWYSRERNGLDAIWPVHRACNIKLKDDDYRRNKHSRYDVFHQERKIVQGEIPSAFSKKSKARRRRSRCKWTQDFFV